MSSPGIDARLDHVKSIRSFFAADMMKRRNVVACGIGFKVRGAETTRDPSVMVSVTHKEPSGALDPGDLIPEMLDGVPTDVVETGELVAYALDRRSRVRPVRPGISVGHQYGGVGTLSCIVRRGEKLYLLSNNHVFALVNQAQIGDAILQPGAGDAGSLLDQIGRLASYIPIRFVDDEPTTGEPDPGQERSGCSALLRSLLSGLTQARTAPSVPLETNDNVVDAALAELLDTVEADPAIVDVGGAPLGVAQPQLGSRVIKSGRTTGLTQGTVTQVDVTANVRYGDRLARFTNQIMITPFSQPGDSGSLVLDYERNAVGLLFSGSDQVAVANPFASVLAALNVDLVTEP